MRHAITLTTLLAVLGGCSTEKTVGQVSSATVEAEHQLDVLFVIDESGSMVQEMENLTVNFPRLIDALETLPGGLPDVHIGVVSSSVGLGPWSLPACETGGGGGVLQDGMHGCTLAPPADAWLADRPLTDCTPGEDEAALTDCRERNFSEGTLAEMFSCIARLGSEGCGFEQPLQAMRLALDGTNAANDGFRRPDAFLAVVILADEDDCSAADTALFDTTQTEMSDALGPLASYRCTEFGVTCDGGLLPRTVATYESCEPRDEGLEHHPQHYVDFLDGLVTDPAKLVVSVIAGDTGPFSVSLDQDGFPQLDPSCENAMGEAIPAVRLDWFRNQFAVNRFTSICQADLSSALSLVGADVAMAISSYPVEELPATNGLGCAVGGRAGAGAPPLVLAAVLLGLRRRRAPR